MPAKKEQSVDVSNANSTGKEIVVDNNKELMVQVQKMGGADQSSTPTFPMLRLEHTTDFNGDPNPNRGHFTLATKNDLGEWGSEDLGEFIKFQVVLQRHYLQFVDKDTKYFTGEFDSESDIIPLFKKDKLGTVEVVAEDVQQNLMAKFLTKNDKGRVYSKLKKMYVLYGYINPTKEGGEMVKWKTNMSATVAYSKFAKNIGSPFIVVCKVDRKEQLNGTNKFYAPVFTAVEKIVDFQAVLDSQSLLRDMLPKRQNVEEIKAAELAVKEAGI